MPMPFFVVAWPSHTAWYERAAAQCCCTSGESNGRDYLFPALQVPRRKTFGDELGLIRMFIYFRQMSFLRHLGFLRQRLLHHVAQISKFSGKCRDKRHLINFFKANVIFRCRDILIRPKSGFTNR